MPSPLPTTQAAASTSWARAATRALLLSLSALLLSGNTVTVRGQSALDGFDPNANGPIYAIAVQPDGKILIGGDFTSLSVNGGPAVARNNMARLNPDGTLDTGFDPNANEQIQTIVVQADGKIVVGGVFTMIGGRARNYIARLDATTGLADSFDPHADSDRPVVTGVHAIALQADGKILAVGYFTSIGGQERHHIARLDPKTGLADSFNPNSQNVVYSIALQADGKILVGGFFDSMGGEIRHNIARLDPITGLPDLFTPEAAGSFFPAVLAIAVQPDGKILAGGEFTTIGDQVRNCIVRLDPTTALPDSFDPNASGGVPQVRSISVQADGKILVGGTFTSIGGQMRGHIARLDPATGQADSFNPNASDPVASIAVQADGKVLVGGNFTTLSPNAGGTVTRNHMARLETDGRADQTLNLSIVGSDILATAVQPDGKILIGGSFSAVSGVTRNNIARLNTDGTVDLAFDPNATGDFPAVVSIAVQPDGKILVAGSFTSIGGEMRTNFARLDATSGLADSFDPNAGGTAQVLSIAVQADGNILAVGSFTDLGGQMRSNIARLDATTGLADSFDPNANNHISSLAVQTNGKILAGGTFTRIGGATRNSLARLDAITGLADSFDPNPFCTPCGPPPARTDIISIAIQANGQVVTGGYFTNIGGQARNRIARLDATTGLADSFDPNASGGPYPNVISIAVQPDGKILAAGTFTSIGGQMRTNFARLDATTGLADSFDPNASGNVYSIAAQADGKILAAGSFTSIGGQPRGLFARLSNGTAALQDLAVAQTTITWTHGGSGAQFTRVTFESSTDNVNYTLLGHGTWAGSNWSLTGLDLPAARNFYIRARGYYRSGYFNGSESITESVRRTFIAGPIQAGQAINLSTRMRVETGDNVGIGGFIVTGTAPKYVLLRAIGPSLQFIDVLADPVLELHGPVGFTTIGNDNWRDTQQAAIQATGLAPTNDFESAILVTLNPGAYTAIVKGNNNTSGLALVELYDLGQVASSKLANISTRASVGVFENIVIAGFILGGNSANDNVILRGIGPSLSGFGVPNPLADPTLELRDANGGLLIANNDWQDNPDQAGELIAAGLAPTNPLESGIAAALPPGLYTALLAGLNNGTGIGLVEVYDRGGP